MRRTAIATLVVCLGALFPAAGAQPAAARSTSDVLAKVRAWREAREAEIVNELIEFVSIPNHAADGVNIRRNAEWIVAMMKRRGIEARLLEGDGPPAVFGELKTPGATRTLAFYAHYDGQPADPKTWTSPPFEPVLRDRSLAEGGKPIPAPKPGARLDPEWRLYGRSTSDDKAPIIALMAALDALRAAGTPPAVNLKFFFEGEEEAGSPHLEELLRRNAALLDADIWLCADGPVHQTRQPLLYFGVRGIVTVDLTVYGANRGLHSGHYGNWAPNPAMRLARLLASMKDETGRVLIEGFYDDVEPLGEQERAALASLPAVEPALMREFGLARADGGGRSLGELINEPSLNIDGLRSEYVEGEARTIIPSEAKATLDLRLVKGIDPRRQVERLIAHIRKQGYHVVSEEPDAETRRRYPLIARLRSRDGYRAIRTPMSLPIVRQVIEAARGAFGDRLVLAPTLGGSVPLYMFETVTGRPLIGVPIVNHDNNQHAADENLRLQNLWDGIELYAALMSMPRP